MELTLAWFPIAKATFALAGLGLSYWFFKKKLHKAAIATIVFLAIVEWFAPVKYDGTNTTKNQKQTQQERTVQYRKIIKTREPVHTVKKTFAERMAEENARSIKKNQELTQEMEK